MEQFYYVTACVLFALFGLCIGSFLNVVVYRLPLGMNLATPPSHCPKCNHKLAWYDNIPLLSFIILRGKCRYCGSPITPRYFALELLNCIMWLLCALILYSVSVWYALVCALALSVLLCIAQCDIENMWIPDSLQIALLLVAVCGIFADPVISWQEKIYGFELGFGAFLLFYLLGYLLFRKEALGFGDVKLMACSGLLLGWKATCVSVVVAIILALVGITVRAFTVKERETLPLCEETGAEFAFAPYLCMGVAAALFISNFVIDWYVALFA